MKTHRVIEVTIEEAKEELARYYADTLVRDSVSTFEKVRDGMLGRVIPHFPTLEFNKVIELYGELNLGERVARIHWASQVIIANGCIWEVVFDIENLAPADRWSVAL